MWEHLFYFQYFLVWLALGGLYFIFIYIYIFFKVGTNRSSFIFLISIIFTVHTFSTIHTSGGRVYLTWVRSRASSLLLLTVAAAVIFPEWGSLKVKKVPMEYIPTMQTQIKRSCKCIKCCTSSEAIKWA